MRALLDTHAVLWALCEDDRLSKRAAKLVAELENELVVSVVSAWEIGMKVTLGRLEVPEGFEAAVLDAGFTARRIGFAECEVLRALPLHHRDPFDRMLIAQALVEGIPVVTNDAQFAAYGVQTIW